MAISSRSGPSGASSAGSWVSYRSFGSKPAHAALRHERKIPQCGIPVKPFLPHCGISVNSLFSAGSTSIADGVLAGNPFMPQSSSQGHDRDCRAVQDRRWQESVAIGATAEVFSPPQIG